jgi:hypothetical protein
MFGINVSYLNFFENPRGDGGKADYYLPFGSRATLNSISEEYLPRGHECYEE